VAGGVGQIGEILRLAVKDYAYERVLSGCLVLALAAVLAPLLVLLGLKHGLIAGMLEPLEQDPRNREIRLLGSGRFPPQWFATMRARPEVAFVIPRTRAIAATIRLHDPRAAAGRILSAELIPSAPGDPALDPTVPLPDGYRRVVLSQSAADRLGAGAGAVLTGTVTRVAGGRREVASLPLEIVGVAPPAAFPRDGVFVSVQLLEAVEDFRDGRAVAALDWEGTAERDGQRDFAGFRMYARSLDDVVVLSRALRAQGHEVRTRAADIELVRRLDRSLSMLYGIIAAVAIGGYCLALGASLWASIDRKRRDYAVLRLLGFRSAAIVCFPIVQGLLTGALGWGLASTAYLAAERAINSALSASLAAGFPVCDLRSQHLLAMLALTLLAVIAPSALGGLRIARLDPAAGLHR